MTQTKSEWASSWSAAIGRRIGEERRRAGLTGKQLAERTAELGYTVPRATVANIESGRREQVSVQEVAVIAAALGVPPMVLLYDTADGEAEVMPGRQEPGMLAAEWFAGNRGADLRSPVPLAQQAEGLPAGLTRSRAVVRLEAAAIRAWKEWDRLDSERRGGDADPALDLECENALAAVRNALAHLLDTCGGKAGLPVMGLYVWSKLHERGLVDEAGR